MVKFNNRVRQIERLFNVLTYELQNKSDIIGDTFKQNLDILLRSIPNTLHINNANIKPILYHYHTHKIFFIPATSGI